MHRAPPRLERRLKRSPGSTHTEAPAARPAPSACVFSAARYLEPYRSLINQHLAQDRAGWHKLVAAPPFAIGKPFVRQPRGDTRVTPEDKRRAVVQRAAEIAERRAVFDANNNN